MGQRFKFVRFRKRIYEWHFKCKLEYIDVFCRAKPSLDLQQNRGKSNFWKALFVHCVIKCFKGNSISLCLLNVNVRNQRKAKKLI